MANRDLRTLLTGGAFFEAPRWRDGRWWVSDFFRHAVFTVTPDGREEQAFAVEQQPSGLGWMPDGTLLVVSMRDHRVLRWDGSTLHEHASVGEFCGGNLNDMVVHASGRAYVGNFGFDIEGGADPQLANLIVIEPDGSARVADENLLFPNGIVIAGGDTLIVAETGAARFTAWTIGDDGDLSDRRVYAQVHEAPEITTLEATEAQLTFTPDGCTLDAEHHLWAADVVGRRCARVAPGGKIVDEIAAPDGLTVLACMLGGEDGRTLLLCCAPDFDSTARAAARESILLTTTVDAPHAGLP
jgi:sugar lactone lactonase YvrE